MVKFICRLLKNRLLPALLSCALLAACGGSHSAPVGSARVTITVNSGTDPLRSPGIARAAPIVASLVFTISAPDMTTMTRVVPITAPATIAETFVVPNGDQRLFVVEALDPSGTAAYSGGITANLSGPPVAILISLRELFFTGTRLAGTAHDDYGNALARDSDGDLFVAGVTYGDFSNPLNTSSTNTLGDAFFTKFDVSGAPLWTRQFGAATSTLASGIAVDGNGNIIVVGTTGGNMLGTTDHHGYADCFVAKFDASGARLWTKLIGGGNDDAGNAVAVDAAGNVYVTGFTASALVTGEPNRGSYDVFVAKFDPSGSRQWIQQYGTSNTDSGLAIAVDSNGNSFVAGYTYGDLDNNTNAGSMDFFVSKLDPAGNVTTVQRGGSDSDQATSIAIDNVANMIYVAGNTYGTLDNQNNTDPTGDSSDIFVAKFGFNLASQSTWLIGSASTDIISTSTNTFTPPNDTAQGIAVDAAGNVFVVGSTSGVFTGNTNAGSYDSIVVKVDPATGLAEWVRQIGTANDDDGNAVAVDRRGNVFATGSTKGTFDAITSAGFDAFLMSYDENGVKQ